MVLSSTFILLYVGCIFWTLGYDTIYAYQDRKDDIKNNIKNLYFLKLKGDFIISCNAAILSPSKKLFFIFNDCKIKITPLNE